MSSAFVGTTIKGPGESSFSIDAGLRTSHTSLENAAPNGTSNSNDFDIDSVRIFTLHKSKKRPIWAVSYWLPSIGKCSAFHSGKPSSRRRARKPCLRNCSIASMANKQ